MREVGFANLKLRHGKVSGRVMIKSMLPGRVLSQWKKEELSKEDLNGHSMPVGMLHHLQLEAHIQGGTTADHLCLMLACGLNVDVQTGELKEKRPCEWSELSGIHRTWVCKGFDHCNEIGVIQTKTDYDVIGRLPFVSLANGVFRLLELKREKVIPKHTIDTYHTLRIIRRLPFSVAVCSPVTNACHLSEATSASTVIEVSFISTPRSSVFFFSIFAIAAGDTHSG